MEIKGIAALVTGAGSGLGAATARALSAKGAKVTVLDRNGESAAATAAEIGGLAAVGDVAEEADVMDALDAAEASYGTVRILVNCAGIGTAGRTVGREGPMPLADFERTLKVNLLGTFNVVRLCAHRMSLSEPIGESRGVIINTASVAAFEGQVGQTAYAASKGGIVSMALPLAREFARFGIRVNTLAPGVFVTPLLYNLPEEAREAIASGIPFPARLGEPSEFAHAAVFCVENDYLNAEVIRLDGASRLAPK